MGSRFRQLHPLQQSDNTHTTPIKVNPSPTLYLSPHHTCLSGDHLTFSLLLLEEPFGLASFALAFGPEEDHHRYAQDDM